ncbi:ribonuclease E/G [Escherichia coli]
MATSRAGLSSVPQREGVGEAELASDAAYLKRVWTKVMEHKKRPQTRYQLYGELALAQRVLRDFADAELDRIRVDSRLTYESVLLEFTSEYIAKMTSKLERCTNVHRISISLMSKTKSSERWNAKSN